MFAGLDLMIAARFMAVLGILGGLWWISDIIGDAREAKIYRSIQAAIEKTNNEIDAQLSLDEKIAVVAQRAREKALAEAQAIPAVGPVCPATADQAAALSRIK